MIPYDGAEAATVGCVMTSDATDSSPPIDVTPANVLRAGGLALATGAGAVLGLVAVLLTAALAHPPTERDPEPPGPAAHPTGDDDMPLPVEHGRQVPLAPPSPVPAVPGVPDAPTPQPPRTKTPADFDALSAAAEKVARKRRKRVAWLLSRSAGAA